LYPNKVNVNPSILSFYTCAIVPRITRRATLSLASLKRAQGVAGDDEFEDDGNYGSAATIDVEVLQSISKRVHYGKSTCLVLAGLTTDSHLGKFVSEAKFGANPAAFIPHIIKPNRKALEALITKPEVERKLLLRLQKKAATYAQDIAADGEPACGNVNGTGKIDVDGVVDLYESYIIPLTKEVEVCGLTLCLSRD
jgi:chorismate mutase